jgi:hypothetical protein
MAELVEEKRKDDDGNSQKGLGSLRASEECGGTQESPKEDHASPPPTILNGVRATRRMPGRISQGVEISLPSPGQGRQVFLRVLRS